MMPALSGFEELGFGLWNVYRLATFFALIYSM